MNRYSSMDRCSMNNRLSVSNRCRMLNWHGVSNWCFVRNSMGSRSGMWYRSRLLNWCFMRCGGLRHLFLKRHNFFTIDMGDMGSLLWLSGLIEDSVFDSRLLLLLRLFVFFTVADCAGIDTLGYFWHSHVQFDLRSAIISHVCLTH